MRVVATLPEHEAAELVAQHPEILALGSRSRTGLRRIRSLLPRGDIHAALTRQLWDGTIRSQQSIPMLSPGIRDPIPCVTCAEKRKSEWWNNRAVIDEHQVSLKFLANGKIPMPDVPELHGSGIVYVGGGPYWPGIAVGIRLLREAGCKLPIQVWHRGAIEPVKAENVRGCEVQFVDTLRSAASCGGARILGGWEAKLWAITHCPFRRILYLDADAYAVSDPTAAIESDGAPFRFWRDLDGMNDNIRWPAVWRPGDGGVPQIQGGQLLIDIERAWPMLCLAHWMNQHSDFYYRHMFGDQDSWRVALAAIGRDELWQDLGKAPWLHPAFVLPDPTRPSEPMIVHRCRSKLFQISDVPHGKKRRHWYAQPDYRLPREVDVFNHFADVIGPTEADSVFPLIYEKRLWGDEDPSGSGSSENEAAPWVDFVNAEIVRQQWTSVVDLGSGSGTVLRKIHGATIGIDVCESLIKHNRERDPDRSWEAFDFQKHREQIPSGDMLLIKDVLHHWPSEMIVEFLDWLSDNRDRWKQILICGDAEQKAWNANCHLGGYRALSATMFPLSRYSTSVRLDFLHKQILEFHGMDSVPG